jgi:hypothetical protein
MDQDRVIRFAIPPFFFFASLLWGAYLGGRDLGFILNPEVNKEIVGILSLAAAALLPIGFMISALSINGMRFIFWCRGKPTYEAVLDQETLSRLWKRLQLPGKADEKKTLYVAATFDHECLQEGVHLWLFRRWQSMNLALHSSVALVLAHLFARVFQVPQTWFWGISTVFLVVLFGFNCWKAWSEVMEMLRFQAQRTIPEAAQPGEGADAGVCESSFTQPRSRR